MPYIRTDRRRELLGGSEAGTPGELAFVETNLWLDYLGLHGRSFAVFAEVVGATLLALAEFWWRVVRPYETQKRRENGDVFPG